MFCSSSVICKIRNSCCLCVCGSCDDHFSVSESLQRQKLKNRRLRHQFYKDDYLTSMKGSNHNKSHKNLSSHHIKTLWALNNQNKSIHQQKIKVAQNSTYMQFSSRTLERFHSNVSGNILTSMKGPTWLSILKILPERSIRNRLWSSKSKHDKSPDSRSSSNNI